MNKSLRSTLQSSLRVSCDEKFKKNCDNLYLDERIQKFYECKYCSNEFKLRFFICEECKECHTHSAKDIETKRNHNLRKSSVKSKNTQFLLNLKKPTNSSDKQINIGASELGTNKSPFKVGLNDIKKSKINKTPSKSESKSKTQNVKKLSKFAHTIIDNNIVRIDTTNMNSIECMCSLIKHRSLNDGKFSTSKVDKTIIERVSRNTLYNDKNKNNTLFSTNQNSIDSDGKLNLDSEKEVKNVKIFTKCPFKGRYYKPEDPDNKICDICLKNCTKKNKRDLDYNQGNIDFNSIIECGCPKNTNHENYTNLLNFLLNSEENKTIIDKGFFFENIIFLVSNFLDKFNMIESKYSEFQKTKSRKKDCPNIDNDFSIILCEEDFKSNFPILTDKFAKDFKNNFDEDDKIQNNDERNSYMHTLHILNKDFSSAENNISSIHKIVLILNNLLMNFDDYFLLSNKIKDIIDIIEIFSLSNLKINEFISYISEFQHKFEESGTNTFFETKSNFNNNNSIGKKMFHFIEINLLTILLLNISLRINYSSYTCTLDYLCALIQFIYKYINTLVEFILKDLIKPDQMNCFYCTLFIIISIQRYIEFYLERIGINEINHKYHLTKFAYLIRIITNILLENTSNITKNEIFIKSKFCNIFFEISIKNINITIKFNSLIKIVAEKLISNLSDLNSDLISASNNTNQDLVLNSSAAFENFDLLDYNIIENLNTFHFKNSINYEEISINLIFNSITLYEIFCKEKNISIITINNSIHTFLMDNFSSEFLKENFSLYSFKYNNSCKVENFIMGFHDTCYLNINYDYNGNLKIEKNNYKTCSENSFNFLEKVNYSCNDSLIYDHFFSDLMNNDLIYNKEYSNFFKLTDQNKSDFENNINHFVESIEQNLKKIYKTDLNNLLDYLDNKDIEYSYNLIETIFLELTNKNLIITNLNEYTKQPKFINYNSQDFYENTIKYFIEQSAFKQSSVEMFLSNFENEYDKNDDNLDLIMKIDELKINMKKMIKNNTQIIKKILIEFNFLINYISFSTNLGVSLEKIYDYNYFNQTVLKLIPLIFESSSICFFFSNELILNKLTYLLILNCDKSITMIFKTLLKVLDVNKFNYDLNYLKNVYNRLVYHVSFYLIYSYDTKYLIGSNEISINSIDFNDMFDIVYVMFNISKRYKYGLDIFNDYFNNFFSLFIIQIKNCISYCFITLESSGASAIKYSNKKIHDEDFEENYTNKKNLFFSIEYLTFKKLIKIVSVINNDLIQENKKKYFNPFNWYILFKISDFNIKVFLELYGKNNFLGEKFEFVNIFIDFIISLFPYLTNHDNIRLNKIIQTKSLDCMEDICIESFYSDSKNKKLYSYKNFFVYITNHIIEIIFGVLLNSSYEFLIVLCNNSESSTFCNLFLLKIVHLYKILTKFMSQVFKRKNFRDYFLKDIMKNKKISTSLDEISDVLNEFNKFMVKHTGNKNRLCFNDYLEMPIIDILTLLFIFVYKRQISLENLDNLNDLNLRYSIQSNREIELNLNYFTKDFLKLDSYMKLANIIEISSKLIKINNYSNYVNNESHIHYKLNCELVEFRNKKAYMYYKDKKNTSTNFEIILNFITCIYNTNNSRVFYQFSDAIYFLSETITEDFIDWCSNIDKDSILYCYLQNNHTMKNYHKVDKFISDEIVNFDSFLTKFFEIHSNSNDSEEIYEGIKQLVGNFEFQLLFERDKSAMNIINDGDNDSDQSQSEDNNIDRLLYKKQSLKNNFLNYRIDNSKISDISELNSINYNNLTKINYYYEFTNFISFFNSIEDIQSLLNKYIVNKNKEIPKLLLFFLSLKIQNFLSNDLNNYKFIKNCKISGLRRIVSFMELNNIIVIMKGMFQDNPQKFMIEQEHHSLPFPNNMYGYILLIMTSSCCFIIKDIFNRENVFKQDNKFNNNLNSIENSKLVKISDEYISLVSNIIDLSCEYMQGSPSILYNIQNHIQFSIMTMLKCTQFSGYLQVHNYNEEFINQINEFKINGYQLLK